MDRNEKLFLIQQDAQAVPGMSRITPIGGGNRVPQYIATMVWGPFDTREEAVAQREKIKGRVVLIRGEEL